MRVRIYIHNSIKSAKKTNGAAVFVLECPTSTGENASLTDKMYFESMTKNEADLEILLKALKRLVKKSLEIEIFTESNYLISAINNHWLEKWQQNDWKNAKGQPIKHSEKWQEVLNLLVGNEVIVKSERHSYSRWMESECDNENNNRTT